MKNFIELLFNKKFELQKEICRCNRQIDCQDGDGSLDENLCKEIAREKLQFEFRLADVQELINSFFNSIKIVQK